MKILAIETTTKNLSVAIADENSILAEYKGEASLRHSQDLIPNIDSLLKRINSSLIDLDCFAISIGPGSFTGLRVGVAILKGLNVVTNIPIVSVPTLDVIAHNAIDIVTKKNICVIVDAKKGNLYSCLYKKERDSGIIKLWDYQLLSADELIERLKRLEENILFIGDGIALYRNKILEKIKNIELSGERFWSPDAKVVAQLARDKFKRREFQNPDTIVPMYMYSRECNVRGIDR